ncbi:MAG: CoA-binding protein, partial [Planktomarina sp.]
TDADLTRILDRTKIIALVGASMNQTRASYFVGRYMTVRGYTVIPINPGHVGKQLFGQTIVGSLADAPQADMVDIFRRADTVPGIVDEALDVLPNLKTIWMQLNITHDTAAAKAQVHGIDVIQDRCPKIEYQRLFGELRKGGIVTGIISSKLPKWRG